METQTGCRGNGFGGLRTGCYSWKEHDWWQDHSPAGSLKIRSVEVSGSCVSGSYVHFVIKCSVREMTEFLPFLYENANLDEIRGDFILQKRRSFNPKIWDLWKSTFLGCWNIDSSLDDALILRKSMLTYWMSECRHLDAWNFQKRQVCASAYIIYIEIKNDKSLNF